MERRRFLRATGTVATGGLTAVAGCTGGGGNAAEGTADGATTPTSSDVDTIQMVTSGGSYYFDPIGLYVEPGETITWTIESGAHSTTAYEKGTATATVTRIPKDAEAWNSGTMTEDGATFEYTFDVTGTYDYFCIPHKSLGMVGRIVVGEPGGPAVGEMPPDGAVPTSETIVEEGAVSYESFSG